MPAPTLLLPVLPLLSRLPVPVSARDSWMFFSHGHCFTAPILPAPLGLAQMSPPLGLITPLRVSPPAVQSWLVAPTSRLASYLVVGLPVFQDGL